MTELPNVANFLSRAAQQCGFEREKFVETNVPDDFNKVVVILFLGDDRALSILSMLLFKPYVETVLKNKYVILCSYPGFSGLFPKADEYWSVSDSMAVADLMSGASGFTNSDKRVDTIGVQLRRHFLSVITEDNFKIFYDNGLTSTFFDSFKKVERFLPAIPYWRGGTIETSLKGGQGVFLYPVFYGRVWSRDKETLVKMPKEFWIQLVEGLIAAGYSPVVYQNQKSHDISTHFGEKCHYCSDRNIISVLAAMRATGFVLDLFSGISRLAVVARCPFLVADERQRYVKSKEYEINDLCVGGMYPYRYVFSFPTLIGWANNDVIKHIVSAVGKFLPHKAELPPASESCDEVPYDVVRKHKAARLGVKFIKVEKLEI